MAMIHISDLSFAHPGGRPLFENVSLRLDTDWKLGLIGRNGRGKTTFLKLLTGELRHQGVISSPALFDRFPVDVDNPSLPGAELARRLYPDMEPWRLEKEASLLELPLEALHRPFSTLSGGESTKLLLAFLFLREGGFPLIDEPTNHLDAEGRQALGRYLKAKRGFILVSHDRDLLDACVDHVLSINKAGVELQRGNFSSWQRNREQEDLREEEENRRLKKEVARLAQSARRSEDWSMRAESGKYGAGPVDRGFIGHKAAKMMRRAKAVEGRRAEALEEKALLLRNVEEQAPLAMRPLAFHSERLAELRGVSIDYGGGEVVAGVSFTIRRGERLALSGRNGGGKSSLLKLLAGQPVPCRGDVFVASNLRVSYVPQDASFVSGSLKNFARDRGVDEGLLRAVLHRFGLERDQFEADMGGYSAGQKKKALLAASLCQEAHLYLWDEPLNYVDVISRVQIEDVILACRPTMVLVEHDRAFVRRVATMGIEV